MKEGDRLEERYRLDSVLGRGGMGVVYRAFDERLERPVAVKMLSAGAGQPGARERFLREARRTAQLRHPNLIEVFDVGQTNDDELFFVMELLAGELLAARAARIGAFDLATFAAVALPICDGVGFAHEAGVVHRDLKPENVMLVQSEGVAHSLRVKVLDFGIFKDAGGVSKLTEAGSFVGTPAYAAPEQIRGEPLDVRADVYALGVSFYELLAGRALFEVTSLATLIHHQLSVEPRPLRDVAPAVPDAVAAVVARCLAKSPADRWSSAATLGRALAEALGQPHEPRSAPRASSGFMELDADDEDANGPPLELDVQPLPVPPSQTMAPVAPAPAPLVKVATFGGSAMQVAPPPSFLAPLGVLPVSVGKRVAVYSLFAAVLAIGFHVGALTIAPLVIIGVLASIGWWVRSRIDSSRA